MLCIMAELEKNKVIVEVYPNCAIKKFKGVEKTLDIFNGHLVLKQITENSSLEHKKAWNEVQAMIQLRENYSGL